MVANKEEYLPEPVYKLLDVPPMWGNKALSLKRLSNLGLNVPFAAVVPCDKTSTRPRLRLDLFNHLFPNQKFAVRSGAPLSMPGMMQTILNVPVDGIQGAAERVWDSWNTEHAKEYRRSNGIADSMGTAVIIQLMMNATHAGVAFTNDPDNYDNPTDFKPIVEYVEGLGDGLVGGEVTPKRASEDDELYKLLLPKLKKVHEKYGASDIEWGYNSNTRRFYFVQQRKLKFNPPAILVNSEEYELGTQVAYGRSIGAKNVVRYGILRLNLKEFKPRDIIYIEEFKPEYYSVMTKASAILCAVGGTTCHAAIVARELGLPAITDIERISIEHLEGCNIAVIGQGAVFLSGKKVDPTLPSGPEVALQEYRKPDFSLKDQYSDNAFVVNDLLSRFYVNMDAANRGEISDDAMNGIAREIAQVFNSYLYAACICEARHAGSSVRGDVDDAVKEQFVAWGLDLASYLDRVHYYNTIPEPPSVEVALEIITTVYYLFRDHLWNSSYGGKKWAGIADVVRGYIAGELSDIMFVDACFNLQHNGGAAFNKFSWVTFYRNKLQSQLDAKAKGDIAALKEEGKLDYINCPSIFNYKPENEFADLLDKITEVNAELITAVVDTTDVEKGTDELTDLAF